MVSKFLEVPGLEALQPPVLLPPRINTYKPEVERWRQQAWDHMPPQLKNRADAGRLLDKYLYVMQGESGGRDTVMHDGGNGYGLMADRVSRTPVGSSADTQIKNAWKLVANNPDKWTDWGEGSLYQGKPFGVLGATPYGGSIKPPSVGDAGGAPSDYLQPGVNPLASGPRGKSLSDYLEAGRQQDAQQEDPLAPLDTGFRLPTPEPTMTVQVGQPLGPTAAPAPPAPPQTPQQAQADATTLGEQMLADQEWEKGPRQQTPAEYAQTAGEQMLASQAWTDAALSPKRIDALKELQRFHDEGNGPLGLGQDHNVVPKVLGYAGQAIEAASKAPTPFGLSSGPGGPGGPPTGRGRTVGELYNTDIPVYSDAARWAKPYVGDAAALATKVVDPLNIGGTLMEKGGAGVTPAEIARFGAEGLVPVTAGDTALALAPGIGQGEDIARLAKAGYGAARGALEKRALQGIGENGVIEGVFRHVPNAPEAVRGGALLESAERAKREIPLGHGTFPAEGEIPPLNNTPSWVRDAMAQSVANADRLGLTPKIEELARQGLTAKQIRIELDLPAVTGLDTLSAESMVRAVRERAGIKALDDVEGAAKPLPGQAGMFGETVDATGQVAPMEGVPPQRTLPVESDPARGEFGRQGEAFPDPNAGAQPGLMTEGTRTPGEPTVGQEIERLRRLAASPAGTDADRVELSQLVRWQNEHGALKPDADLASIEATPLSQVKAEIAALPKPDSSMHAAEPPPQPKPPEPTAPQGEINQETQTVKVSDLTYRPDLFQQRDVPSGAPADPTRVNQIVRGWNDKQFQPPSVVPDPDNPGKYIVYNGHHRTEAYRIVKGNDANIDVIVTKADIKDPQQLRQIRIDAAADNYTQAPTNFREQVRTARSLTEEGVDAAEKMRLTPSRVADLLDADRLGPQAIERVAQDKSLEPYAIEYGRAMRQHEISIEDANGLFNRLADSSQRSRPTPASVRETMDKFGGLLKQQRAAEAQGAGMFGADTGQFAGFRGEMLTLMDEYARKQDALKKEIRALERNVKGVRQLAAGASPADRQLAAEANATFKAIGEGKIERLKAELAHNEENLNRAARGEAPVPYEAPAAEPPRDNLAFETPPGAPRAPGGAPPDGGVPPPPGRPPAGDDPAVDVLNQTIEAGGAVAPATRRANHMDLSGRVAAADELRLKLLREGVAPAEAMAQSHSALAGAMQQASFATPAELAGHLPELHKRIASAPVSYFTKNAAHEALDKLAQGIFPMAKSLGNLNHGLRALGEVFGPRTLTALEDLSDVLRLEKDTLEKLLREPIKFPGTSGPLTPEAVGELLAKQIKADAEISERVAGRIVDAGQLRISRGPSGPEITTAGGHERGLQGVIEDFIDEMPDATWDEPGMGPVRGLGGPKTEFPSDYPLTPNPRELPGYEAAGRRLEATPGPGPTLEIPPNTTTGELPRFDAASLAERARLSAEYERYNGNQMTRAEYDAARAEAGVPGRGDMRYPPDWTIEDIRRYQSLEAGAATLPPVDPLAPVPAPGKLEPVPVAQAQELGAQQYELPGRPRPDKNLIAETAKLVTDLLTFIPFAAQTGWDLSFPLRQAAFTMPRNIVVLKYAKDGALAGLEWGPWAQSFAKMFHAAVDEKFTRDWMNSLVNRQWAQFTPELHLSNPFTELEGAEGMFASRLWSKIPGFKQGSRAVTMMLNAVRTGMVDRYIATKVRLSGGVFPEKELIDAYSNYVNRLTGWGNLGAAGKEQAVAGLQFLAYSLRRNVSMVQAPMQMFNVKHPEVAREAMLDFVGFAGFGLSTMALADAAGLDVTWDINKPDWGAIKLGDTRVDIWAGYTPLAKVVYRMSAGLVTGEEDDTKQALISFLRQKLAPVPSVAVDVATGENAIHQKFGAETPVGDFGVIGNEAYRRLVPLAWQGLVSAVALDGANGAMLALPGFLGVSTQSYVSPADARDKVSQRDYGVPFDQLDTVSERDKVNKSPEVLKVVQPSELKIKNDQRKAAIDAKEKGYEDGFKAGALDKPLPEYFRDISIERQAHREDFQADFKAQLDQIDQPGFQKIVNGYYEIKSEDLYGQPGFDVQAAKRQEYLDKLSTTVEPGRRHSDRQVMDDYLTWVEGRKSPMRQEYDAYIAQRKALGYYDEKLNTMTSGERAVALRELDVKNPQMDVDNWYWKGGLKDASLAPRLNSAAGVDLALKKAPDRPVQLSGLTRPINQNEQSLKMWKDSQKMVSWYQNDLVPQNQEAYAQRTYRNSWAKLTEAQQTSIKGRIVDDTLTANPQLNAVLVWWGHGDTFHSYASGAEFDKLKKTYGSEAWEKGKPAKPLRYTTDAR